MPAERDDGLAVTDDQLVNAMALASDPMIRIAGEVLQLLRTKSQDYNAEVPRDQYWVFGLKSLVQMLWTKVLRLVSLTRKDASGQLVKHESVEDTCKDLVAYSLFTIDWLRRNK